MSDKNINGELFSVMRRISAVMLFIFLQLVFACQPKSGIEKDESMARISKLSVLDEELPVPQSGDWLAVHDEKGQTFEQYKASNPVHADDKRKLIYLRPLGVLSVDQQRIINYTAEYLEIFYGLKTIVEDPVSDKGIPQAARRIWGGGHEQFLTGYILDHMLLNDIPEDAVVVMAITNKDLYPSSKFNFVFGQARLKERVGVSSIYRFTDEPLNDNNFSQCLERMIKTSSHEIGHMFSCKHCTHALCVMNGTNSLPEADSRPNRLCSECFQKLHWNLSFDIDRRQKKLVEFMKKHQLTKDAVVLAKDLHVLESEKPSNIKGLYD